MLLVWNIFRNIYLYHLPAFTTFIIQKVIFQKTWVVSPNVASKPSYFRWRRGQHRSRCAAVFLVSDVKDKDQSCPEVDLQIETLWTYDECPPEKGPFLKGNFIQLDPNDHLSGGLLLF